MVLKVDLVQASTGELFKKAEAEKRIPCSRCHFSEAPTPSSLLTKIFFEPYISQENDQIIPEYQNKTGFYALYT